MNELVWKILECIVWFGVGYSVADWRYGKTLEKLRDALKALEKVVEEIKEV